MVLNLLRVEALSPEFILSRSFYHFQAYKNALVEEKKIMNVEYVEETELSRLLIKRHELYSLRNQRLSNTYREYIISRGRVVDLMVPRRGYSLPIKNAIVKELRNDTVSVYVFTNKDIELMEYPLKCISNVYDVRCKVDIKVFSKKFKVLDYVDDLSQEIAAVESLIKSQCPAKDFSSCLFCKNLSRSCLVSCVDTLSGVPALDKAIEYLKYLQEQENLQEKIQHLEKLKEIYHMDECKKMILVLKRLEYIDETSVLLKGKMASEISACDELVITEMIFNSEFTDLPLTDMVSLLSCMVCEEKPNDNSIMSEDNDRLFELIVKASERVCDVRNSVGIEVRHEEYVKKFSYEMMDIVKMWLTGRTFVEVCDSTSVFEGTIIRTFKRLEELLRQLSSAAAVIGNSGLVDLFGQGIFLIKRDIIFANSLYL